MYRIVLCLPLLAALLILAPSAAQAPKLKPAEETDALFNEGRILDIKIDIGPKEMEALRRDPRNYVPCTLKVGDQEFKEVGIQCKGAAGSFRGIDDKPGLTLNMDKFLDGQLLFGMDKFHLANSVQDPSYISELLCGELFRAAGVPASRVTHAVVTINGKRKGFYYLKEGYDKAFLTRHFQNNIGNFYDGGFLREIDQPLQLVSTQNDVKDHADLKALNAAAREKDHAQRFQKLDQVLDMDKFISYLALEVITWDWDGYPMNRNNYRIYHDPKRNKLTFIPSGMDQMWGDPNGPLFPNIQGFVARALLETPEGRARYLARVAGLLKTTYNPDNLVKRLDELQARVQPALAAVDKGAGNDYPNHVNRLKNAIRQRAKSLDQQLENQKKK